MLFILYSTKDCKYFNKGHGTCPFGNKCFYLHALPDGTKTDVGPPVRQRRNADGEIDIIQVSLKLHYMLYLSLDKIFYFSLLLDFDVVVFVAIT